jgi:hypothetical protein
MSVILQSSGGGQITLQEPATASNFTQTLPAGTGTIAVQGVSSNIVSGSAVASTSGTSIDFTGIPSWVRRITVMFSGVSLNGSSTYLIQVGAGSVATSGYASAGGINAGGGTVAVITATNGFPVRNSQNASNITSGIVTISLISGNVWISSHALGDATNSVVMNGGGTVSLGGTLDRVRITTANGTDTFDAGSINILYE